MSQSIESSSTGAMNRPSSEAVPGEKAEGTPDVAFEAQLQAVAPSLRGRRLTAALAFVAGTGFTLFGCAAFSSFPASITDSRRYDQGVMSALLSAGQVGFNVLGHRVRSLTTRAVRESLP